MIEKNEWPQEPGHIAMAVMGSGGDIKKIWNKSNEDEVEDARRTFYDMRRKGYLAFRANKDGGRGEQIREFDPDAEQMIMVPPMQGG